jgi:hypothetical protein
MVNDTRKIQLKKQQATPTRTAETEKTKLHERQNPKVALEVP